MIRLQPAMSPDLYQCATINFRPSFVLATEKLWSRTTFAGATSQDQLLGMGAAQAGLV
jgi:hypothetical protein